MQAQKVTIDLEHKTFSVVVTERGELALYVDDCLRKRRQPGVGAAMYVWTNIELHWEEHRFIEARYFPSSRRLCITVNRETVFDRILDETNVTGG